MNNKLISVVLGSTALVALLAGCSTTAADKASETKKPSATSSATAAADPVSGKCVDGAATVTTDDLKDGSATIGDCDTVYVLTNDAKIALGAVKTLSFEGTGNTVTHTGAAPKVNGADADTKNTVTAK